MKLLHVVFLMLVATTLHAQESYFYFNWDVNIPTANKSWIGTTSTRGAKVGYRHFVGEERKWALGVDVNWAYYEEYKPTETFQNPGGAITTDYFNDIFQVGLTANGQYYFPVGERQHIFPYAGIGLGVARNDYSVYYNIYSDQETKWGFLARPEAGVLFRIGTRRRLGLMAGVHYDYSTAGSDTYSYKSFSSIGFQLGLMLMQW